VVKKIGFFAIVFLLLPAGLVAQNSQSATGGEAALWGGAEASAFNPDWGCPNSNPFCQYDLIGPTALVDFNLHGKYGIEGEARWLHWRGAGNGEIESNYLAGPHYRLARFHRVSAWAKLELGGGWITTPDYPQPGSLKGSYFVYAPGGTVDYYVTRRLAIRGDYEWEIWPGFSGPPSYNSTTGTVNQNNGGLSPNGFSVGVVYKILGGGRE
jgi:hypothetical protein